jgi:hypothetical protein
MVIILLAVLISGSTSIAKLSLAFAASCTESFMINKHPNKSPVVTDSFITPDELTNPLA